jgi:hypothetical protein
MPTVATVIRADFIVYLPLDARGSATLHGVKRKTGKQHRRLSFDNVEPRATRLEIPASGISRIEQLACIYTMRAGWQPCTDAHRKPESEAAGCLSIRRAPRYPTEKYPAPGHCKDGRWNSPSINQTSICAQPRLLFSIPPMPHHHSRALPAAWHANSPPAADGGLSQGMSLDQNSAGR